MLGVDRDCIEDLELALVEACTNVLVHAGAVGHYVVSATISGAQCVIEVADHGSGFDPAAVSASGDSDAEHGRGLLLMRALIDRLEFNAVPGGGTIARLSKELSWGPMAWAAMEPPVAHGPHPARGPRQTMESGHDDDDDGVRPGDDSAASLSGGVEPITDGVAPTTAVDLEAIRRRQLAATAGPWARHGCDVHAEGQGVILRGRDGSARTREQADADAEFVAHAPEDVVDLLRALAAAEQG